MRKYDVPSARDLGGLPSTAYVAVRTAKEAFTTTRRGSSTCLLATRDSVSLYLILPLYGLGENKISRGLRATNR